MIGINHEYRTKDFSGMFGNHEKEMSGMFGSRDVNAKNNMAPLLPIS